MATLNLTLGAKGGIGKSFVAALLAQYLAEKEPERPPVCLDLDGKNKTFSRYAGLGVALIDVESRGDIDRNKFDLFVNRVAEAGDDETVVADTGGNIYIPLASYLKANAVLELLAGLGHRVVLHVPVMGGADLFPTLDALYEIASSTPAETRIAVWINQRNGPVEHQGKSFEESRTYGELKPRLATVCYIPLWRPDMQANVSALLEEALTFEAALRSDLFGLMDRQRLAIARRLLYESIERAGVCL
jgi:hypothetical protein